MNEKAQIYTVATISVLVLILFSGFAGHAAGALLGGTFLGITAGVGTGLVCTLLIWQILNFADREVKYRHALYWDGVEFTDSKLMSQDPKNIGDAKEVITVLKQRLLDADDARNEAVDLCNKLKAEQNKEAE